MFTKQKKLRPKKEENSAEPARNVVVICSNVNIPQGWFQWTQDWVSLELSEQQQFNIISEKWSENHQHD